VKEKRSSRCRTRQQQIVQRQPKKEPALQFGIREEKKPFKKSWHSMVGVSQRAAEAPPIKNEKKDKEARKRFSTKFCLHLEHQALLRALSTGKNAGQSKKGHLKNVTCKMPYSFYHLPPDRGCQTSVEQQDQRRRQPLTPLFTLPLTPADAGDLCWVTAIGATDFAPACSFA
jgi:hypothetical protein